MLNVLVACEESQRVASAFRLQGCLAYSADIKSPSGGHPEYHIKGNVLPLLARNIIITTMLGEQFFIPEWDLIIAHPPCTYLTIANNRSRFRDVEFSKKEQAAVDFFRAFVSAPCRHICIENPRGVIGKYIRRADQEIYPSNFCSPGHPDYKKKRTCLWLYNLPPLEIVSHSRPAEQWVEKVTTNRPEIRSKTFSVIANAMATQWTNYILNQEILLD